MKRGDATMVATVLLIVAAIIVGVLVVTFSRETEKRVEGKIIDMGNVIECEDIGIGLVIGDTISIKNTGTLGINKIYLRGYKSDGTFLDLDPIDTKINPNDEPISSGVLPGDVTIAKVEFIPVIITENDDEIGCEKKIVTWKNE